MPQINARCEVMDPQHLSKPALRVASELTDGLCAAGSSHPAVAKVAFTGSVATGRRVNMAAAANLRPTTMELGGKSAIIVFEDADVANAVEWVMVRSVKAVDGYCYCTVRRPADLTCCPG